MNENNCTFYKNEKFSISNIQRLYGYVYTYIYMCVCVRTYVQMCVYFSES